MLCINKDSKEFKYLANRFKVSTDTLAEIIYKYYEEAGSSDNFPSDTYIQAQLGNRKFVSNNPLERTLWEKDYKTPKYFSSSAEWEAAKTKAKSFFPDSTVHSYENIDGYYVLRVEEPVEKFEPLHRKDFESWKEYNDYALAMKDLIPAELRDKENQVIGKQNFTFKDGTSITVPFKPNEQQEEALNTLNDFLHNNETVITLSGYAGTGKTSLMEIIAKKAKKDGINIVFSASTNKAASVLKNRVKKAGFTAQTLNKVFGIQVEVDSSKPYDASNLISKLKEADISKGTVVVIDEASMINTENYRILNNIAENNGLKIIYVGDQGQLPPVKESQVSKVFRGTEGRTINLTKVERTDDNAILKEATAIRNGKSLSGESSFNSEGKGVAYIKNSNKASIKAIVEKFVPQLRTNPDYFRILAYTNSAVSKYNEAVRKTLGYTDSKPRVGEPIVGYSNWGYIYDSRTKTGTYKFINSEAYTVVNVDTPTEVSTIIGSNTRISMQAIPITLEDSEGKRQRINFIDIKENSRNRQNAIILAKEKARLFDEARHLPARQKVPLLQEVNSIEQFLFVNDDIIDNGRTLQKKVFDFGYAMTVHKSQGSTFTHVLIDDADIAKSASGNTNMFADVALNFEEPNYDSVEFEGDVALDFSKAPTDFGISNTVPNNRTTNIRQQLEYVAVSRATDTVSIISNNVKTEDTPLKHLPKTETSKPSSIEVNRKEMTPQLTQQVQAILAPLGNKVHGLADMQKYFQEHPDVLNNVQQAIAGSRLSFAQGIKIPKGADKYLLSSAIMSQANTFEHLTEQLNENVGSVAKRVIFFGNDAYLWNTENGYEFFIEQVLPINENNYNTLNGWVNAYGTDTRTADALRNIEKLRNEKTRKRSYIELAKRTGSDAYSSSNSRVNGLKQLAASLSTGTDGNTLANTESQGTEQFFIGKKARTQFEQSLRKARPDMSDAEIQSTLDFLHSLEDNKENTAYIKTAIHWVANRSITLPQDNVKARQAFDLARKKHIDLQKYNTLGELIAAPEMQPKEKEKKTFNPDTAKTFSNKRTVTTEGGRVFTVYDVENTEEGQREVCKALAAHYEMSPWCLSTFTATGEPTESAKRYWQLYNSIPRKIAFENGKPVAFNSNLFQNSERLTFRGMYVSKSSGEFKGYYITDDEAMPAPSMKRLIEEGLLKEDVETGYYEFTEKGEHELLEPEAWWDMEDTHPQDSLSDSIISDPKAIGRGEGVIVHPEIEHDLADFNFVPPAQWNQLTREEIGELLYYFLTPDGEVYGFVAPNGDIYLDETKISPEHPIHEYTHLWDRIVAKKNPKLWKRGVQLMKRTSLWKEIENNPNYGQRWKSLQDMTTSKLESLIASEVHARFVGEGGQQLLDNLAKEKGAKGIINRLKQWILDFWKDLKATFSDFSDEEIQKLTLKDFNHMTMRDFADAVNFATAPSFSEFQGITPEQVKQAKDLQRNKIESLQGTIDWFEERKRWDKATKEQLEELTKLRQDLTREQSLYDGLDTGASTITINEYGTPQVTKKDSANANTIATQRQGSETSASDNFRTYGDAFTQSGVDDLVQELLDDGYSREDIKVQHIPATETEDDYYIVKVRDNTQAANAVLGIKPSPTPSVTTPQRIKLPGYEYFNDLYEDTAVDAAWKIPILQDLDSQLSTENTEEENMEIIAQMDRVLQAISEEDYNKTPTAERQEVNQKMTDYERRNTQINNLIDNNVGLTATDIREVSQQIVDAISDIISEIKRNPDSVKEMFPYYSSTIDLTKATRKEIANAISIDALIAKAKENFENLRFNEDDDATYEFYDDDRVLDQADLILDNWETVIEFAADAFLLNEGFSIKRNTDKQVFETEDREFTGYDYDNYVDPQDEDATREEKDEQEHWQVESRTIGVMNSMSDLVRLALHECYELDSNGNIVKSKWGIPKRINKAVAVNNILKWTQGTLNINEMIDRLSQRRNKDYWVSQLIQRLQDSTGEQSDFQSQFYGVMHRHFQLYSNGKYENGVFKTQYLNSRNNALNTLRSIYGLFQLKSHPLFTSTNNVNQENLKVLKGWYDNLKALTKKYSISKDNNGQLTKKGNLSQEDFNTAVTNLTAASKMLGYIINEETMQRVVSEENLFDMQKALRFIVQALEKQSESKTENYDPFNYDVDNNIRGEMLDFLTPIVEESANDTPNAFFEGGKMYQSYVIPSFLTQLFDQFKQPSDKIYTWMNDFYGKSEWFKDRKGNWRNGWLDLMYRSPKAREIFDHKVQLNFNKHDYMRNMTPEELTISFFTEYFSERIDTKNVSSTPVWFRVPIQSNKPSSEFIRFYADRSQEYKDNIAKKMYSMFLQEISRIDTVRKRNKSENDDAFISSFDENGRKFMFLPFLNAFLLDNGKQVAENTYGIFRLQNDTIDKEKVEELKKLLNKKVDAKVALTPDEDVRLEKLVQEATKDFLQHRADNILNAWDASGVLKAAEKVQGIKSLNHTVRENVENFLWNDYYAANNILQLTIVDKAFYPNATELQKRLAELHAPGTRGNKYATDYKGNRVSDGYYRTLIIRDFKGFISNVIDNISTIFDRKIEAASESEKAGLIALKEALVGDNGAYRRINVTDAQAYLSPSAYRKKALMFGKWSHAAEEIYQRLKGGNYNLTDLQLAFQPLKPFVYGHVSKNLGVSNAPITNMPVPMQAKNAEYLLIMAGALTESTDTGRPNLLKVIHDIMEESEERNPTKGIDTIQFDSAIKSGGQGIIDISGFANSEDGEIRAAAYIRSLIYQDNKSDDGTNYNYDTYIQKTDYDNYALQQEVPAHFKDHQQAEGSQQRMNIPADLDFYDYNGDVNYYTWKDSQGNEHSMNAKEIRKEYEEVHAKNIRESYNSLVKDLHLDSSDKKARNLALSEILQEEIMSSPRYGIDLFQACQIDPATGEFRIPKGDPIHAKRIEQLCNSIIKNRVNKQKIAGGPIVQVTNFGTSKQLHIRFHDKNGGLIPLESEYKAEEHDGKTYKEYIRENQAGIAEFEVFAPASSKKMLEIFQNPDGSINIDAVRRCDPELLKLITGRIPNEDKYSIAHARIVGFLPALAGEAIMFPYELTEIDDSDFDVDKRYTMRKEMDIVIDYGKVRRGLINAALRGLNKFKENNKAGYEKWARQKGWGKSDRDIIAEQVDMFLNDPERMKDSDSLMQSMYKEYQRIIKEDFPYKTRYPKEGTRAANNNQIFDMSWAILSNEMTADKMLNPGGFEIPKHAAYVINAYKNKNVNKTWEELDAMKTKDLQKLSAVERDLALVEDHIQYYKQNAAGSNLIGVFAVNKVAHAILEGDNILVSIPDFCGGPFTVCDTEFKDLMPLDDAKDSKGNLVGKNIGSGVGASADTAKDPWLDLINTNMTTAGMFNTLMRMGMPMNDVELFMAQPAITNLLIDFNRRNLVESVSLDQLLGEKLGAVANAYGYTNESVINTQPLTKDELKERLRISDQDTSEEKDTIDYKVLLAFSKIKALSEAVRKPTAITRFNSMAATVGPLIIDNLILEQKLQKFLLSESDPDEGTGFYVKNEDGSLTPVDADYILSSHPILREFSRPADLRDPMCVSKILFSDMPAGSYDFKVLLNSLPSNIKDRIYDDRQLLSSFSDFYQSYMLVANGVINPENIRNILFGLPDEFVGKGLTSDGKDRKSIKEQYPDNPFIQAIQLDYDKKSGRAFLNISTTGMDERAKERLRVGWTDLHKVNPDLSTRLFTYAFFRGGVGFSPKTFMSLVPVYVKEHIKGYVDTYRHFPYVTPKIVIQQFVRNNWDNYTLAPIKGGEGTNYIVEPDNGRLFARDRKDVEGLKGITFMRTIVGKETYLWELVGEEYQNIETREYKRIMPLGNNGEYIEMSLEDNMKAMETTVTTKDRQDTQEFPALSSAEKSATDAEKTVIPMSEAKQAQNITDVVTLISKQNSLSREQAKAHFEALKERVNSNRVDKYLKSYLVRVFQQAGVTLTQENALKEFKKFC